MYNVTLPLHYFVAVTHNAHDMETGVVVNSDNVVVASYLWTSKGGYDNEADFGDVHVGRKVRKDALTKSSERDVYTKKPADTSPGAADEAREAQNYFRAMCKGVPQARLDELYDGLSEGGKVKFHTVFDEPLKEQAAEAFCVTARTIFRVEKVSMWEDGKED